MLRLQSGVVCDATNPVCILARAHAPEDGQPGTVYGVDQTSESIGRYTGHVAPESSTCIRAVSF